MSRAGTRWPVRRVLAFGSGSAWVVWTVPGSRQDGVHHSDPATCRANFSSRPVADRCPRPCRRQGMCRWPATTWFCALRHGRCLCKLRVSCAESILLRVCFVLDVLAHMMWRARTPGVDDGKPVQAACLEPPAPVPTGAGVGVSSKPWLRDNDLDAQERSQTQWLTPY